MNEEKRKCNFCGKEIKGDYCVYCGQTQKVLAEKTPPAEVSSLNTILFLSYLLVILSCFANFIIYFAIIVLVLAVILLIMLIKKIKSKLLLKNNYLMILSFVIVSIIIVMIPTTKYVSEVYSRNTFGSHYRELTNINLPDKYSEEYDFDEGYQAQIRRVFFKAELTKNEYSLLLFDNDWIINDGENYFMNLANASKTGYYLIYNCQTNKIEIPTDRVDYQYVVIELLDDHGAYYLQIYDIMKRNY